MKNLKSNLTAYFFAFAIVLLGFSATAQNSDPHHYSIIASIDFQETTPVTEHDEFHHDHSSNDYDQDKIKNSYRYTSHFGAELTSEIEAIIIEKLGTPSSDSSEKKTWESIQGNDVNGMEVILKSGRVKIIYKHENAKVMKTLEALINSICKVTYRAHCD